MSDEATARPETSVLLEWNRNHIDHKPVIHVEHISNNDFLKEATKGVYTSARTVGKTKILLLDAHIQRLSQSINLVDKETHPLSRRDLRAAILASTSDQDRSSTPDLIKSNAQYLKTILLPLIRQALAKFYECVDPRTFDEAKITLTLDDNVDKVVICVSPLYKLKTESCHVTLGKGARHNPMAKSLDWVQERRQLEKLIQPPINEVILYNPDSLTFFEGLSSNFFVTMPKMHSEVGSATGYSGFKVVTAPLDTVLLGTVMRLVLEVCRRDGVEVVYDNPRVDDLLDGRWHGAFITSTSRLVYPIEVFHYRSEASGEEKDITLDPNCPLVRHICLSVLELLKQGAHSVFDDTDYSPPLERKLSC